ncbi:hypothetical protein GOODEAATRI_034065 [Goodea atripinnis]|uniref:Uncharacterized protein n=1 Tax=Goodea atripinnis TaxID=208336 RepID=A0ABV0PA02_9TELE
MFKIKQACSRKLHLNCQVQFELNVSRSRAGNIKQCSFDCERLLEAGTFRSKLQQVHAERGSQCIIAQEESFCLSLPCDQVRKKTTQLFHGKLLLVKWMPLFLTLK